MRRRSAPAAVASNTPAPANAPRSLIRPLGVVGYDTLEPALLAALATEEPLLLVRLANALGLARRSGAKNCRDQIAS
jgi:hypothetical protein